MPNVARIPASPPCPTPPSRRSTCRQFYRSSSAGAFLDAVVAASVKDAGEPLAILVDQRPIVFACEGF
jgi:hypothetical protein